MTESRTQRSTIERAMAGRAGENSAQVAVHVGFVVCMLVFVVLYAETYRSLIRTWADTGTFQYAFLIFPISAVLIWARRHWLARVAARPRPIAFIGLAALGLLWLLGAVADINLALHITAVLIWPVMVYLFYGPRVAGVLAFALGYLLFAIPFGNFMVGPLQTVTAHLSVLALELTGVPVVMDGHFIDTPASAWHVAEACSGIKFFVATTAFGVLYAHLFYTSLRRRLVFVGCALVVPIIANALRVYFTILIGEYFGLKYATGTDHLIFGWQFFGTVLLVLFLCGWPWHQAPPKGPEPDPGVVEDGSARMRWMVPAALALIVLPATWYAVTGLLAACDDRPGPSTLPSRLADQPALSDDGNGHPAPPTHGLDVHLARRYGDIARPVQVDYLGVDAGSDGPDILDIRQGLYDAAAWHVVGMPKVVTPSTGGPGFQTLTLKAAHGDGTRVLLYSYRIGERWLSSPLHFKMWQSLDRLFGQPAPAGILVVSEAGDPRPDELARMAADAAAALQRPER
ncbi:exosortase A [Salinisphaera hydrothermalis]|uniref:Eight transmembrane protein EpsH, putative exosortase n=1 Tax=Salinisphaera hydrothermalis (strain C41B8) TaxID=1304275 RepID=A0A084IMC7_SALHC|nr:exosortase A [Salinisphaera hydrothermalis]KEZ77861.1 eight transmembrane protein EpsH, putative exosortase [Salinisphaera hydrothermalis C41B8]